MSRRLITAAPPEDSFSHDPLRMLRAARFASQLDFDVDDAVVAAVGRMAGLGYCTTRERFELPWGTPALEFAGKPLPINE